jgi:hypothetical protein
MKNAFPKVKSILEGYIRSIEFRDSQRVSDNFNLDIFREAMHYSIDDRGSVPMLQTILKLIGKLVQDGT